MEVKIYKIHITLAHRLTIVCHEIFMYIRNYRKYHIISENRFILHERQRLLPFSVGFRSQLQIGWWFNEITWNGWAVELYSETNNVQLCMSFDFPFQKQSNKTKRQEWREPISMGEIERMRMKRNADWKLNELQVELPKPQIRGAFFFSSFHY